MKPLPQHWNITLGEGKYQQTVPLMELWQQDYDNVAEAAVTLPGFVAWLGYYKGEAIEKLTRYERLYKEAEAEAYFELKGGKFESAGYAGKPTEEAIKKAVCLIPSVRAAAEEYEHALAHKEDIVGIILGVQAKLDLIRTSEATKRRLQEPTPVSDDDVRGG